ncbi:cytochrome b [Besnoitia besnoiti]|uniref:Cytochrome b n=1 Tax=Besnoitia besnoiti TaxID=94643 RepID=A0A2A9M5I8_BESBE|nr:cytochrome b [Besnoitia besnoiti]PFH30897.1 cytochrome b [Besnoitia besnoiti]
MSLFRAHLVFYRCALNLNSSYNFGFLVAITFVLQIITGITLAFRYTSEASCAFASVQLVREVAAGWEFRMLHATTASFVFLCILIHMSRGMYNSSYSYLTTAWMSGLVLYLLTIATAFLGYVLPWGQMSFWGATVITNLLSPIPYLVPWLLGGYYVSDVTLKRFFVLHFILPFVGCILIVLHIFYLHLNGSSNPAGIDSALKVAFYPHMLMTDAKCLSYLIGLIFLQTAFGLIELSHPDNSIPVNRFVTPLHIVPEWYFLAYYAVLKVIPSKTGGLLVFMSSLINLALLSEIRALNTRMLIRQHFMTRNVVSGWVIIWVYSMIFLIIIGSAIPQATYILYGRLATIVYLTTGLVLCLY